MSKLVKYISEYFLGTETRKFYKNERKFYREVITDEKELAKFLRDSEFCENSDIAFGKFLPNLIDIGTIAYSLITKSSPHWGLLIGEGLRLCNIAESSSYKKVNKSLRGIIKSVKYLDRTVTEMDNKVMKLKDEKKSKITSQSCKESER